MSGEMIPDERVIKTYVWHGGRCFFVSTINRESSAIYGSRYAETIVWDFDWKTNQRGALLHMEGDGEDCIGTHLAIVKALHKTGTPPLTANEVADG